MTPGTRAKTSWNVFPISGELSGGADGLPGEIEPGDGGAPPGPPDRVGTHVALEVKELEPLDWAQFAGFEFAEGIAAGAEPLDVVEVAYRMEGRPLVPHGPIVVTLVGIHDR